MKGLILKDLINLKGMGKAFAVMVVFYIVLALTSGNNSMLGAVIAVICGMLPITVMAFDEKANWDKYALTMPVSRKDMVLSKYILGLLLSGFALLLFFAFNLLTSSGSLNELILLSLAPFAVGITFMSAVLPIIFKCGVEKGRLLMMLVLFVPTALIVIFSTTDYRLGETAIRALPYIVPVAVVAVFVISVAVSLKVYHQKEF